MGDLRDGEVSELIRSGAGFHIVKLLESRSENKPAAEVYQVGDAVAIGQLTPGPILSTATFVGFVVADDLGLGMQILFAIVATLGIFLPSFLFVGLIGPIVPKLGFTRRFGGGL